MSAPRLPRWFSTRFLHQWCGLIAALWLAVLGVTGFLIDHRDWRWQWQHTVDQRWLPERVVRSADQTLLRQFRVNPADPGEQLGGGERGLWHTVDGGAHWQAARFVATADAAQPAPLTLALESDPRQGWERLWLGSDDGLWRSLDGGRSFQRVALAGRRITALNAGSTPDELLAVVDRGSVWRIPSDSPANARPLPLAGPDAAALPASFSLARYLHDVHVGQGLAGPTLSLLVNDFTGLAWLILGVTGWLYWLLPKYWQRRRVGGTPLAASQRRRWLAWTVNSHSSTLGIAAALSMSYLALTGIYWDHMGDLGPWARGITVPQRWLTPAFRPERWAGWIDGVASLPATADHPEQLLLAGRLGLLASSDGGRHWQRLGTARGDFREARRLSRLGELLLVPSGLVNGDGQAGAMGSGIFVRDDNDPAAPAWRQVHAFHRWLRHAPGQRPPTEVAPWTPGRLLWRSGERLYITDRAITRLVGEQRLRPPAVPGVPWAIVFSRLHSGVLIYSEWKWINDLFAVLALLLAGTGLLRWWPRKWLSAAPAGRTHGQPAPSPTLPLPQEQPS